MRGGHNKLSIQEARNKLALYTSIHSLEHYRGRDKSTFIYIESNVQFDYIYGELIRAVKANSNFMPRELKRKLKAKGILVVESQALPLQEAQARIDKYTDNIKIKEYCSYKGQKSTIVVISTGKVYNYCLSDLVEALKKDPTFVPHPTKEDTVKRREATMIQRYGVTKASHSKELVAKAQATIKERYGSEGLGCAEIRAKKRVTYRKNYGVDHPFKLASIVEKATQTNKDKYGCVHYSQTEECKARKIATNMKNCGYPNYKLSVATRIQGSTLAEIAERVDVSVETVRAAYKQRGEAAALAVTKATTSIESTIESILPSTEVYIRNKQLIGTKYRPDFVLPKRKLIIEVDGLYWHSDAIQEDNNYHVKKLTSYKEQGYKALFFRSDEIENSIDIIKSMVYHKLGLSTKVMARKCKVVSITSDFFIKNHLMGKGRGPCLGLEYKGSIVAAIQYCWLNKQERLMDVSRYCTTPGQTVVGGFSRLLQHAITRYRPLQVQNFIDCRYGTGSHLESLGFKHIGTHKSFRWTNGKGTFGRMRFPGSTGYTQGLYKIWDCGQAKYLKTIENP